MSGGRESLCASPQAKPAPSPEKVAAWDAINVCGGLTVKAMEAEDFGHYEIVATWTKTGELVVVARGKNAKRLELALAETGLAHANGQRYAS